MDNSGDGGSTQPSENGGTGSNNSGGSHSGNGKGSSGSGSNTPINTIVIGKHAELSEYSLNLLRNLKGDYEKIVITSTRRSPEEQANIMLQNIKNTGVDAQLKLYANPGDAVIRAYNPKCSDAENLAAMIAEIYNQGPRKISKHCLSAEEYRKLNVIDISRRQMKNPSAFIIELKNTVPNIIYHDETYNKCIHIEIPQP